MIGRYRDGVVPEARAATRRWRRLRRTGGARPRAARPGGASAARSTRSGSASSGSTATSQDEEPWKLAKDEGAAETGSTRCSTRWPRGCGRSRCCCYPFMPELGRAPAGRARAGGALARRPPRSARGPAARSWASSRRSSRASSPSTPPDGRLRGRHPLPPRLTASRPTPSWWRGRAPSACTQHGHGRHERRVDRARTRGGARASRAWWRSSAATPTRPTGWQSTDIEPIERAAADPRARAIGETGLDYFRDHAPREDQRRAFEAQLDLAARARAAARDPHARGRGRHLRHAARARGRADRDPPLLLRARAPRRVRRARLLLLVRRQRDLPDAPTDLQAAAREVPDELLLVETDSPYLAPQPRPRQAERAGQRRGTRRAFVADLRGVSYEELERHRRAQRRAGLRLVSETAPGEPAAPARVRRAAQPRARARTS